MSARITLQDIAKSCGVSRMSVSQILRYPDNPRYSQGTRQQVLRVAAELGYVRNRQAISLRTGTTGLIGLILPWNIPELMDATARLAAAAHCGLLMQFSPEPDPNTESRALQVAIEHQVDRLIWMPSGPPAVADRHRLQSWTNRVILLEDHCAELPEFANVQFDYRQGFQTVLAHAVARGYRQVVYFGNRRAQHRCQMLRAVAAEWQIAYAEVEVANYQRLPDQLPAFPVPTLLLGEHDWIGIELNRRATAAGWAVPEHIGIAIIGDLLLGNHYRVGALSSPPLTALQRDFTAMAAAALHWLDTDHTGPVLEKIPLHLTIRHSTEKGATP